MFAKRQKQFIPNVMLTIILVGGLWNGAVVKASAAAIPDVHISTPSSEVLTYSSQPNGAAGMDTYIFSNSATTNFGADVAIGIGENNNATSRISRGLIKFDLSSIPSNATIVSATLSLWTASDLSDNDRTLKVYRLKVPFNETQATWNAASTGVNWQVSGASGTNDRESVEIGSVQILANETLGTQKQISLSPAKIQSLSMEALQTTASFSWWTRS